MHGRFPSTRERMPNNEYWAVFHCNLLLMTGITGSNSGTRCLIHTGIDAVRTVSTKIRTSK
jgi:hypothetical protein